MEAYRWKPIEDINDEVKKYENSNLFALIQSWRERLAQLQESEKLKEFNQRLCRQWAIETGIVERVYTLDRGITQVLIEKGINESLIPHGASDKSPSLVISIITDQKEVIDGLFDFVAQRRALTTSYIKQMHQVFMRNQPKTDGIDNFGNLVKVNVIRGEWKKWPNNPKRPDGQIHEYCPPEQVASEMDRLINLHDAHSTQLIDPVVESAWLHHRFTQIHPFQDGNGRIARALASLIFIKEGWFPLVILDEFRDKYIDCSEQADTGNLLPLIELFADRQIQALRQALSLSEDIAVQKSIQFIIQQSLERLKQRKVPKSAFDISKNLEDYAHKRLTEVSREVSSALHDIESSYWSSVSRSDESNDYWFKGQIIQTAKMFDYYANFRYRSWIQLKIKEQRLCNFLFSFHGLGYEFSGIMAVSAFLEFRADEDTEVPISEGPYSICTNIFQFSYRDELSTTLEKFKIWMEEVVLIGLEQWRKQL